MRKLNFLAIAAVASFCVSCSAPVDYKVEDYRTTMQFHDNFKVMQLADLHLGVQGDTVGQLNFIETLIKHANPDLIVLTGDQFMLANTVIVNKLFERLNIICDELSNKNEHITKFAMTYGNHDFEGDYHRFYINNTIKKFVTSDGKEKEHKKYAAFIDYNDDNLEGLTNYFIDLLNPSNPNDIKYRINILDSNSYHFTGIKYEYDVIHEDQLQHMNEIYNTYDDKDYIGLAYFHIPFEEFYTAREQFLNADDPSIFGRGEFKEGVSDPYINNGSFEKMRKSNIHAYFVGHDHINHCDLLFNATSDNVEDKAIFSYGVKSTDMIYHDKNMLGYKLVNLKDNISEEEFLSIDYINNNIFDVVDMGGYYGK